MATTEAKEVIWGIAFTIALISCIVIMSFKNHEGPTAIIAFGVGVVALVTMFITEPRK